MLRRLFQWSLSAYFRSPARSWVITTVVTLLVRMVRSTVGRRELIDVSSIEPGEMIVIEHLGVSHKKQLAEEKTAKRRARRRRLGRRSSNDGDT